MQGAVRWETGLALVVVAIFVFGIAVSPDFLTASNLFNLGVTSGEVAALSAPFDVEKAFGTRARVPVRGTINGFPFRSSLMPMGGCHRMVVNKTIRDGAGVKAGDTVSVVMARDEESRTIDPPPLLKKELAKKGRRRRIGRSNRSRTRKRWRG